MNLREKIEGVIKSYSQPPAKYTQGYDESFIDGSYYEDLTTEIETLVKPLFEALKAANEHIIKAVDEAGGCPYDNCRKYADGTVICLYEDCIHYHAADLVSKALKEFKNNEEDR